MTPTAHARDTLNVDEPAVRLANSSDRPDRTQSATHQARAAPLMPMRGTNAKSSARSTARATAVVVRLIALLPAISRIVSTGPVIEAKSIPAARMAKAVAPHRRRAAQQSEQGSAIRDAEQVDGPDQQHGPDGNDPCNPHRRVVHALGKELGEVRGHDLL